MKNIKNKSQSVGVQYLLISSEEEDQRIDNFLIKKLKGVPKAHIYRIIRKGEVRINKKRISASYRLLSGDSLRLPPISLQKSANVAPSQPTIEFLTQRILYEDDQVIILNKPAGMSVHSGSSVRIGVIEAMRHAYPRLKQLELAHRLDSETSGCLILAKKRSYLREIHQLLREGKVQKIYWALTQGKWKQVDLRVDLPLHKTFTATKQHKVYVSQEGKPALTVFRPLQEWSDASLMEIRLYTGRTHQIRVHAKHQGHPIAGDSRYGDEIFNQSMRKIGLRRMFLHAYSIDFILPSTNKHYKVNAPLDPELIKFTKDL